LRFRYLALLGLAVCAHGGPPFQTDDPQPIDFRNYEFYVFSTVNGTIYEWDPAGPALEFNWGALPNLHLYVIVPVAAVVPSNNPMLGPTAMGPNVVGLGDMELGIKYRFIQETKQRPMVGTFVMFEMPTGNVDRGLGVGRTWYKLPLWVQKSWGPWTAYGGGGEAVFRQNEPGFHNYAFAGALLQRDLGKKLTLGLESFYHAPEGSTTPSPRSSLMLDLGGYYKFRDPGFQLLFCYGHSVAGQAETYAYLGLYWTWGHHDPNAPKDGPVAMNRMAPPGAMGAGGMGGF